MMKTKPMRALSIDLLACLWIGTLVAGCQSADPPALAARSQSATRGEVERLLAQIANDLAKDGLLAWLRHFSREPGFFMATYGELAFASYSDAETFLAKFAGTLRSVELVWSKVRIEPLTPDLATIGAAYAERIVHKAGAEQNYSGWFTGVARKTQSGWKLTHLHWSSPLSSSLPSPQAPPKPQQHGK